MPKRSRESTGGEEAGAAASAAAAEERATSTKKRRESGASAAAAAEPQAGKSTSKRAKGRASLGGGKQMQAMGLPSTMPARLKEGQELVLLRYPAGFDLARLEGCALPAGLLAGALGGGHTLQLQGGGAARLAAAPRSVASQGLYVAVVAAAPAAAEAAAGEGEAAAAEAPQPSAHFLPAPAARVLDLALLPQAGALPGLRSVVLTRRTPVARA